MKRLASLLCTLLLLCLLPVPAGFAEGGNSDTLTGMNIKIDIPEGASAVLDGNEYYIYAQRVGEIPYVMVRTYRYDDELELIRDFTAFMRGQYADLKVTAEAEKRSVGDKDCFEIDYAYTVSGYEVRDRRIVAVVDGLAYMFASKEIDALGRTVGSMLDEVVAGCEFLGGKVSEQEAGVADGYLYSLDNGMPKYWLDFSGSVENNLILHCYFRSGDPRFYERLYILDLSSAAMTGEGLEISRVYDQSGLDCSAFFKRLTLRFYLDGAVMLVERDESTLAGGGEDNLLTGTYAMKPIGVGFDSAAKQSYPLPMREGPYQAEELGAWARIYYFRKTGIFPPIVEVAENPDATFTLRLRENEEKGGESYARYTVDAYGAGRDDATGETLSLMR